MAKTLTIDFTKKLKSSYSLKGITAIKLKGLIVADSQDFLEGISYVKAIGNKMTVVLNELSGNLKLNFTNCNDLKKVSLAVNNRTILAKGALYNSIMNLVQYTPSANGALTGSIFDDNIDLSGYETNLSINAGNGNDTIKGGSGNDTITGGAGSNKIVYNGNAFGTDTIVLTNGEKLTLDLSGYALSAEAFKNCAVVSGKDLLLNLGNGTVKLKNFAYTNAVGSKGAVAVRLDENTLINLNTANYINVALMAENTFSGSRFSETIDASGLEESGAVISAGLGNDIITGSNNADTINGGAGNDTITGGKGNDKLTGGAGSDTFLFNSGDGADTITDAVKGDVLKFNNAKRTDLLFFKNGNHLEIRQENSADKVIISNYFKEKNKVNDIYALNGEDVLTKYSLATLIKADGYVLTGSGKINGTTGADKILGSTGNDIINAGNGNDTIYGTAGNDTLTGGLGTNRIVYSEAGFGTDRITLTAKEKLTIDLSQIEEDLGEVSYAFGGAKNANLIITTDAGTINIANFGASDVTTSKGGVFLKLSAEDEPINLRTKVYETQVTANYTGNWHNEVIDAGGAEARVVIDGGAGKDVITGSDFNDTLKGGAGVDTITGGEGNDIISGGAGSDIFIFSSGDGADTITDSAKGDVIRIDDENITNASAMRYKKAGNNLELYYGGEITEDGSYNLDAENKIVLKDYYKQKANARITALNINGTEYTLANQQLIITDRDKKGNITGTSGNDYIVGSANADIISAGAGVDTIIAGKGNDKIYGVSGTNTMVFSTGDGNDTIYSGKGTDTIQFADLEDLSEVRILDDKINLYIKYSDDDMITLNNYKKNKTNSVQFVQAGEGEAVALADLITECKEDERYFITGKGTITGTSGDDFIEDSASADIINAGAGNDTIYVSKGNDTITGGVGENRIVFNGESFGNDAINLTKGEKLTLDLTEYEDVTSDGVSFAFSGKNLVIKTARGNITLNNFGASDVTGGENGAGVELLLAGEDEPLDLRTMVYDVNATNANYTGNWHDENILATATTKAITVASGLGDDTIEVGENNTKGTTIQYYWADKGTLKRNGHDTIIGATSKDTLYINIGSPVMTTDFRQDGDDLVACFWQGHADTSTDPEGSITLVGYYAQAEGERLDKLVIHSDAKAGPDTPFKQGDNKLSLKTVLSEWNGGDDEDDNPGEYHEPSESVKPTTANTLVLPQDTEVDFSVAGNNLIIGYNDAESVYQTVTLENYATSTTCYKYLQFGDEEPVSINSYAGIQIGTAGADELSGGVFVDDETGENTFTDDIFFAGAGNDVIKPNGGYDIINAGAGTNTIKFGRYLNEVTVINGGGTDTLWFPANTSINASVQDWGDEGTALEISCWSNSAEEEFHNRVMIMNYDQGTSVKYIKVGNDNPFELSEILPATWYGTKNDDTSYKSEDGTKTISASRQAEDTFMFGAGSDKLTFGKHFGNDTIYSDGTYASNIDDLTFSNYSLSDGSLSFGSEDEYSSEYWGEVTGVNLKIYASNSSAESSSDSYGGDVTYKNYLSSDTPKIRITDSKGDKYFVEKYDSVKTIDYRSQATSNHVAFINNNEGQTAVLTGNAKANYIRSRGSAGLLYQNNGAKDTVVSDNYDADDTYSINSFTKATSVSITDNGGDNDVVKINVNSDDVRYLYVPSEYENWYSNALIHKDNLNAATLKKFFTNSSVNGVTISADQYDSSTWSNRFGIEKLVTNDNQGGISLSIWRQSINDQVIEWLDTFGVEDQWGDVSLYSTLKSGQYSDTSTAMTKLVSIFNTTYADAYKQSGAGGEPDEPTEDKPYYGENSINGNDADDIMYLPENINKPITVNGGKGDDYIYGHINNSTVYGGDGNDELQIGDKNNTIYGGKGNDYMYIDGGDNESLSTVVFNNGDGHDLLYGNNLILNFADSLTTDFSFEKFGDNLIIKYNEGNDSVAVGGYFYQPEDVDEKPRENNYTIVDKNGESSALADIISTYGNVPESTITTINGNDADDIMYLPENINKPITVNGGKGDDYIYGHINNSTVYGGDGNDELQIGDKNNTIYGGKGNDYMYIDGGDNESLSTVVFNNGDGHDLLYGNNLILNFADSLTTDFSFEKFGDNLIIKYNEGNDSVAVGGYFYQPEDVDEKPRENNYTIEDKNGESYKLSDLITNYTRIKNITSTTINGTSTDDYMMYTNGNWNAYDGAYTINANDGDDYVEINLNNSTVNGGDGNDVLRIGGKDNIINPGKGNDHLRIYGKDYVYNSETDDYEVSYTATNTVILHNGDGNDDIGYETYGSITLKFADTLRSDLTFERMDNDLFIKYNSGADSIRIQGGYSLIDKPQDEYQPIYTIEDKNGTKTSLKNFVNFYGDIPEVSKVINGTSTDDYMMYTNGDWSTYNGVYTINANDGDDYVEIYLNNSTVNGGNGNDRFTIGGKDNIINGGKGNDHFRISGRDYVYNSETDNYEVSYTAANTVVFHNGDGNDDIGYLTYGNITLKFADTLRSDLTFEHMDNDLFIKYNSGADSIRIQGGYSLIDEPQEEYKPIYTIEDKNGKSTSLKNFVNFYGDIPEVSKVINGTSTDDYMMYNNGSRGTYDGIYTINANDGDDYVEIDLNSSTVNGGDGNDVLRIGGKDNIINPGKGNDHLRIYGDEKEEYNEETGNYEVISVDTNTVILHNGDGNDDIGYETYGNITLKFADTLRSDLTFERIDNDLLIKYNSGADSIRIQGGLSVDENYVENNYSNLNKYTIEDKNGESSALADIISTYGNVPESTITTINGNDADDIMYLPENINKPITVNGGKGDDYIYGHINNSTVYGGDGNDELQIGDKNNTIYGGKGNDYMYIDGGDNESLSTVVFNNGDGHDLLYGNNLILNFADSLTTDFSFEKFGDNLIIKYNEGNDSVAVDNYFYQPEDEYDEPRENNYTIVDKNGGSYALSQLIPEELGGGDNPDKPSYPNVNASSTSANETFNFGLGDNIVRFGETFGTDTITSVNKEEDYYTDSLVFTDTDFENSEHIAFNGDGVRFSNGKGSSVTYEDLLSSDSDFNALSVVDKYSRLYNVETYTGGGGAQEYDWTTNSEAVKKHMLFIKDSNSRNTHSISSNDEYNFIYASGSSAMDYTYNGGNDIVVSNIETSNDSYTVNGFARNNALFIRDEGGEDTLNVNTSVDNVRLAFDLELQHVDSRVIPVVGNTISIIHKDAFDEDTLATAIGGGTDLIAGVIQVEASIDSAGQGFGIESVNSSEGAVQTNAWASVIAAEVAGWLSNNGYGSVQRAFYDNAVDDTLVGIFNQSYETAMAKFTANPSNYQLS